MKQPFRVQTRTYLTLWRLLVLYGILCIGVVYSIGYAEQIRDPQAFSHAWQPRTTPASADAAHSPALGITVEWEALTAAQRRADLQRLHDVGFGWVRLRVDWSATEPAPGLFDWTFLDGALFDIDNAGLQPVVVLDGSPDWARAPFDQAPRSISSAPPADVATFAVFAGTFAARYAGSVRYYQIWDEPNIAPHWGNRHIEPVAYAQLLRAAAQAIRAVDPDAYIITAALAPTLDRGHTAIDEVHFLQRLYAAGAASSWDAVAIQPFGFGYAPTNTPPQPDRLNFQRAALIRRVMVVAGDAQTPVWAVRFGWNSRTDSRWGTVTPANQRQYSKSALAFAAAQWPWMPSIGWAIDRPLAPKSDPMWGFALNPQLSTTFSNWIKQPEPASPPASSPAQSRLSIWLLLAGAIVWGWRARAAIEQLRLVNIVRRLVALSGSGYWSLWVVLAIVYYLATWPPLLLVCVLLTILLMMARPHAGLWLATACLPFYYQHKVFHIDQLEWLVPPAHLLIICMALATLLAFRRNTYQRRLHMDRWLALAVGWLVISGLSSINVWHWPGYATGLLDLVVVPLLLFILIRVHCRDRRHLYSLALAAIAGGVAVALIGLGSWLAGAGTVADGMRRLVGPHFSPNHTALYLIRCLILAIGMLIAYTSWASRRLLIVAVIILAPALLLTGSRGGLLLGLPAGIAYLLFVHFRQSASPTSGAHNYLTHTPMVAGASRQSGGQLARMRQTRRVRQIRTRIFGAIVVLLFFGLAFYLMGERLTNSATIQTRLSIWRHALDLWRDYPLFGVGPGGFFWRFPAYIPFDSALDPNLRHPHNLLVEYATFWGIAGLAWLVIAAAFIAGHLRRQHLAAPSIMTAVTAALIAAIAHGQVDAFSTLPDLAAWNWLALALLTHPLNVTVRRETTDRIRLTRNGEQ